MRFTDWATRVLLISLMFVAVITALWWGRVIQSNTINSQADRSDITTDWSQYPQAKLQSTENQENKFPQDLQQSSAKTNQQAGRYQTTEAFARYTPRYEMASVHPSNYGERYTRDANNVPVNNQAIVVLHETAAACFQCH
jgi:hypothetical protein